MSCLGNEIVREYQIDGIEYHVLGCYDETTPENMYDFFDLYQQVVGGHSICLNVGDPFDKIPTEAEVKAYAQTKAQ